MQSINVMKVVMRRSIKRILTTHTGSLPRPEALTRLFVQRAEADLSRDSLVWLMLHLYRSPGDTLRPARRNPIFRLPICRDLRFT
jgi:hypothetical protein